MYLALSSSNLLARSDVKPTWRDICKWQQLGAGMNRMYEVDKINKLPTFSKWPPKMNSTLFIA